MTDNTTIPTVAERLRRLAQIAGRHWIMLVSVTAVATVAAVFVGAKPTKQYGATAKLVLDNTQLVGVPSTTPLVPNPDPERDINTKVALILSAPVANAVDSQLRLGMPLSTLLAKVQAQAEGTSNMVDVTATDATSTRAMAIANAFAEEYVTYRRAVAQSSLQEAAAAVRQQLSQLGSAGSGTPQAAALTSQLRQLNVASASQTGGAIVVMQASRAATASAHSLAMLGLVGAVVGLLLAATLVALLELTDRRLKDGEDVASAFGVRVLAEIPRARLTRQGSFMLDGNRSQSEAYDNLASQLLLAGRRRPLATVMVTSPGADDGKTTVTLGLARALARLDRRVLVIETDVRTSILSGDPARNTSPGLSGVVTGSSTLLDEVVDLDSRIDEAPNGDSRTTASGGISVLPAGSGELPVHRLLSRPEVASMITASREIADFVLIDGPSTHRLHDALGLVDAVDAALMVSRLRWTASDSLHGALEALDVLAIRMLGLVLTNAAGRGFSPARSTRNGAVIPLEVSENGPGGGDRRATGWLAGARHTAGHR